MTKKEAEVVVRMYADRVKAWPLQWGKSYPASQKDFLALLGAGEALTSQSTVHTNSDIRECLQCGLPGKEGTLDTDNGFICIRCIPYPED